jgi:lipid-A-disaccharide synthase
LAKLINRQMLKRVGLLAWPNIWAGRQIVPELVGLLYPDAVTQVMRDYLEHPEKLQAMRSALQAARGEAGAATKLAAIVAGWVQTV